MVHYGKQDQTPEFVLKISTFPNKCIICLNRKEILRTLFSWNKAIESGVPFNCMHV